MANASETEQLKRYQDALTLLYDALKQYARPDFYHAVGFLFDPPCGNFQQDFSEDDLVKIYGYNYAKPGKLARMTIDKLCEEFGDLTIWIGASADES